MPKERDDKKRLLFCFSCLDLNIGQLFISHELIKDHPDLNEWFLYQESTQAETRYYFALRFNKRKRITNILEQFTSFKMENESYPSKAKIDKLKKDNQLEIHSIQEKIVPEKERKEKVVKDKNNQIQELMTTVDALKTENERIQENAKKDRQDLNEKIHQIQEQNKALKDELKAKDGEIQEWKAKFDELKKDNQLKMNSIEGGVVLDEAIKQLREKVEIKNLYRLLGICKLALEIIKSPQSNSFDWNSYLDCASASLDEIAEFIKRKNIGFKHDDLLTLDYRYEKAEKLYRKAIEFWPDDLNLCFKVTDFFIDQKRFEEADEIYEIQSQKDPREPLMYLEWGKFLANQKNYKKAEEIYNQGIEKCHVFVVFDIYLSLAELLIEQKKYEDIEEICKKGDDMSLYNLFYVLVDLLIDQNKLEDAERICEIRSRKRPTDSYAYFGWGKSLTQQNKYQEAEEVYRKGCENCGDNSKICLEWATLLIEQKKYEEIEEMLLLLGKALDNFSSKLIRVWIENEKSKKADKINAKMVSIGDAGLDPIENIPKGRTLLEVYNLNNLFV